MPEGGKRRYLGHPIAYDEAPAIGTVTKWKDQTYTVVAVRPYTRRRSGVMSALLTWVSGCRTCGVPFEVRTGLKARIDRQRCAEHRRPSLWLRETTNG